MLHQNTPPLLYEEISEVSKMFQNANFLGLLRCWGLQRSADSVAGAEGLAAPPLKNSTPFRPRAGHRFYRSTGLGSNHVPYQQYHGSTMVDHMVEPYKNTVQPCFWVWFNRVVWSTIRARFAGGLRGSDPGWKNRDPGWRTSQKMQQGSHFDPHT